MSGVSVNAASAGRWLKAPEIRHPFSQHLPHLFRIEAQQDLFALYQDRPLDEIGILGHEGNSLGTRRWRLLHLLLAIQLVARIEKRLVIAIADERIQFLLAQAAIEIDLFEGRSGFAKKTLRVAAGGSSGLEVKLHHT